MLNAIEARAIIEERRADEIREEVEYKIKKAVESGKEFCRIDVYLPDSLVKWLDSLHYRVQRESFKSDNYTMIYW